MPHPPTPEQSAIISAAAASRSSLMISALAGCAKSTTLEMLVAATPPEPTLYIVFNKKNKDEAEKKFPSHVTVMTYNGLGHRALGKALGKRLTLDDRKIGRLVSSVAKANGFDKLPSDAWDTVRRLVTRAMTAGLIPSGFGPRGLVPDNPETWSELAEGEASDDLMGLARQTLIESIKETFSGTICFDDQIYGSALLGGIFPTFPRVLTDESQDASPLNHLQLRKVLQPATQLIVVGDPRQAIYAFRGADSSSMEKIRALRADWIDLPLTLTFRCPKVVVERAAAHAPGFTAAVGNKLGSFERWPRIEPVSPVEARAGAWTWESVPNGGTSVAVLCRNNAPLLSMAFKLIRRNVAPVMLGRDIGKGLVALSKKLLPQDSTAREDCALLIEQWRSNEIAIAKATGKDGKLDSIEDKAESLLAVLESRDCRDAKGLRDAIAELFSRESGRVTLATGHKAKGLEWDFVIHLDPWRIPSKWATQAAQEGNPLPLEQEMNLDYVISTRTKDALVYADLDKFE